jgi:hypothetical protein
MSSLSKNGKKIVVAAFAAMMIIIGVMLTEVHYGSEAAGSKVQEVQLTGVPVSPPNPSIMVTPNQHRVAASAAPSPWILTRQDKDCVEADGVTLICFIHSTLIGKEAK